MKVPSRVHAASERPHNGSGWVKTEMGFKQHIGTNDSMMSLMDARYPGLMDKLPESIKSAIHFIKSNNNIYIKMFLKWARITRKIASENIDLIKDCTILYIICKFINPFRRHFSSFLTQFTLSFALSIVLPLVLNYFH